MKILNREEIRFADEYTIQNEPIASIDLMERAAKACVIQIVNRIDDSEHVFVLCGKGNNGGDGFAIARMLLERSFNCTVVLVEYTPEFSADCKTNYLKLKELHPGCILTVSTEKDLENLRVNDACVLIDALIGTGLNKPLGGILKEVVEFSNKNFSKIISIDCPSGLFIDKSNDPGDPVIHSSITLTFQYPKLSFLMAQNKLAVPEFVILNIGLHHNIERLVSSDRYYLMQSNIKQLITKRHKFSHKGNFGHALIMAGSYNMRGAALICAEACLRSGAGLLTVHSVEAGISALIVRLPEAMCSVDPNTEFISELPDLKKYNAVAFGPGIGTEQETCDVLKKLLNYNSAPLIIDADGLNIIAENKTWISFLPPETILTPHPKEFDRLTETHANDHDRYTAAKQFAVKHRIIIVLKGTHTVVCMPDGSSYFNTTGNSGLAKGGSGDALTGIITGLIARGYRAPQAALIGVYLHGLASDLAIKKASKESILISDVIDKLSKAFLKLEE